MAQEHERAIARGGRGLILGKFMPPHRGHQFLIDFARHYADEVTVLVCSIQREPIPGRLRYEWVRRMCPDVNVVHVTDENPQEPGEHPAFWDIWRRTIRRAEPRPIDLVFASEDYGWKLAEVLGAQYVPVDHERRTVPVSARQIRDEPMRWWSMIPECVRPHYVRRVSLFGPESTGKSTLAESLAEEFGTVHVWEYARPLLDFKGGRCDPGDIPRILRGQVATEEALAPRAERVMICDTDPLLTVVWSEMLFGNCPGWIWAEAAERRYDLTLLLDVDAPWVPDDQRFFSEPGQREAFFRRCREVLDQHERPYRILRGSWAERHQAAREAVAPLMWDEPSSP